MLDVLESDGRVTGVVVKDHDGRFHEVRAKLVIGADGRRSNVARLLNAPAYVTGQHATTCAYGYFRELEVDGNRWYFSPRRGAGAIPTNEGTLVFASIAQDAADLSPSELRKAFTQETVACAPDLAEPLASAALVDKLRVFPGQRGFLRQPWGAGWALVGDSGYMSDPITAHGITNALRDAELLSRAVIDGSERAFAEYQSARDDLSRTFFEISDRVASFDWDITTVQQYHRAMSEEMNRETEAIVAWDSDEDLAA